MSVFATLIASIDAPMNVAVVRRLELAATSTGPESFKKEIEFRLPLDKSWDRNKLKVAAAVQNAKAFLAVQKEFGNFDAYIWSFVNHRQIRNKFKKMKDVPARTPESDAMSKDLLKRGFKFAGSTICYAFMQAVGMVNDHIVDCFRHDQIG